jgi:hypothetical protein
MKQIGATIDNVLAAFEDSQMLEISECKEFIRRRTPYEFKTPENTGKVVCAVRHMDRNRVLTSCAGEYSA